jgi:hypothetical protein
MTSSSSTPGRRSDRDSRQSGDEPNVGSAVHAAAFPDAGRGPLGVSLVMIIMGAPPKGPAST